MAKNNWYVITGGPSTGKTSLLNELAKQGHRTIPEAARQLIDATIAKGRTIDELRKDEQRFQHEVAKLKKEIEAAANSDALTFFDRGMHDTLAYLRYYNFKIEDWVNKLMDNATYRKVFLLEPFETYQADYARTEDHEFSKQLHGLLQAAYTEYGMKPVIVPAMSLADRVKFVLSRVKQEQPA